jgi:hypothetical protein
MIDKINAIVSILLPPFLPLDAYRIPIAYESIHIYEKWNYRLQKIAFSDIINITILNSGRKIIL